MFQKEFNAGKQFIKDMNTNAHLNIQPNLILEHLNDKNSLNKCHSQQMNTFTLKKSFDNMNDPSIEQYNDFQIKRDLKQTRLMMRIFNKSENQGCVKMYYV